MGTADWLLLAFAVLAWILAAVFLYLIWKGKV